MAVSITAVCGWRPSDNRVLSVPFRCGARQCSSTVIERLRDGSFLVEGARKSQAMGLLKTTRFVDRPIHDSIHKALNSSCGVIRCHELSGMTETEIKTELQEQGCS